MIRALTSCTTQGRSVNKRCPAQTDRNHVPGLVAHGFHQLHLKQVQLEMEINLRMPMCDICKR
eukprot:12907590-Prorocentrum_lima.AAC.1